MDALAVSREEIQHCHVPRLSERRRKSVLLRNTGVRQNPNFKSPDPPHQVLDDVPFPPWPCAKSDNDYRRPGATKTSRSPSGRSIPEKIAIDGTGQIPALRKHFFPRR